MLVRRAVALLGALAVVVVCAPRASAAPVTIPTAVADPLMGQGQGLCVATAISTSPAIDFPQSAAVFNAGMNAFMEAHKIDRVEYVQRTIFDLSNNQDSGPKISWGDFTNAMLPTCQVGGCGFHWNDTVTSFGARLRGFVNVTPDLAGKPVHIGFYADDAVSLTFYDKSQNAYPVMTQPPVLGAPTWRLTETVTFVEPGLYPLEIQYVQIVEHAALEMTFFLGSFTDFQQPANQVPITSLKDAGFTVWPKDRFFQTLSGQPSYPSLDQCKQCDRQFVGQLGNNDCDAGYYCNEAALCAPCDTDLFCGPSCSPCGGKTPFCINENGSLTCAECNSDADCKPGLHCDPTAHTCQECNGDADCPRGKECEAHACVWCAEGNKCAGSSCNCCPVGANGKPMQCLVLPSDDPAMMAASAPECVECTTDADCTEGGVCDVLVGLCVPALATNESPTCCGPTCLTCPPDAPLCLPGPFGTACAACRNDTECPDDTFCVEGACEPCTQARHCGPRCDSCGGDTPFCLATQLAKDATCVRCLTDSDCAGGHCDATTHACATGCAMTCGADTPYCDGSACVACYTDTQCPCGGTCDLTTHTCSSSCKLNVDCLGDQHCQHSPDGTSKSCQPGPLPDDADCGSTLADLCGGSIGARGTRPTPSVGILAVALFALLLRRARGARK